MNASVDLTEYSGLVQHVLRQAKDALAPQLGDGPKAAAAGLGNVSGQGPATRALRARFAMGVDPVTYLNNGVAVLAAGTHDEALDVSGLAGGDVLSGVKNAVYKELRRKNEAEKASAPRKIDALRPLVAWLLCIPEVAGGVRFVLLEMQKGDKLGLGEIASLKELQKQQDAFLATSPADDSPADASAFAADASAFAAYVQRTGARMAETLEKELNSLPRDDLCDLLRALHQLLDPRLAPRGTLESLFADIEKSVESQTQFRADTERLLRREKAWMNFMVAVENMTRRRNASLFEEQKRSVLNQVPTNADLVARFQMLENDMQIGAIQVPELKAEDENPGLEVASSWYLAYMESGVAAAPGESRLQRWAWLSGIVGLYGPGEKREVYDEFPYNASFLEFLSVPAKRNSSQQPALPLFEDELRNFYESKRTLLAVFLPGCSVYETGTSLTLRVRWTPRNDDDCRVCILEHVIANAATLSDDPEQAVLAGAAKLMQLEGMQRIRGEQLAAVQNFWTSPVTANPEGVLLLYPPMLRSPPDNPTSVEFAFTRQDALKGLSDEEQNSYTTAYLAAKRCAGVLTEGLGFVLPPAIPAASDFFVSMAPVVASTSSKFKSKKRIANGANVPVDAKDLSVDALLAHVSEGVRLCDLLHHEGQWIEDRDKSKPTAGPEQTRAVLWKEMLREISISSDRLWVFVKLLSGAMGESAETLLTVADEAAQRAQKAFEAEKKAVSEKTSAFHTKLVEAVVGGILRGSKLEAIPDHQDGADGLFVADAELAKDIRALASGESGRPFFEANVAIQGVLRAKNGKKSSLGDIIASLDPIVAQLNESMQIELANSAGGALGVAALSAPRNSYMISLRDDVVASIRISYDRLCHELGSRRISLWELVEGASSSLSLRWAEFVSHVLVATRASSGTSAMFVSQQMIATNVLQTRAALARLISECRGYMGTFDKPAFSDQAGRDAYFTSSAGKQTPLTTNGAVAPTVVAGRVLVNADVSGWQVGTHPYLR